MFDFNRFVQDIPDRKAAERLRRVSLYNNCSAGFIRKQDFKRTKEYLEDLYPDARVLTSFVSTMITKYLISKTL